MNVSRLSSILDQLTDVGVLAMQLSLSLVDVNPGLIADLFEEKISQQLINHLSGECALDKDGINRVMPLLKKVFMSCTKAVAYEANLDEMQAGKSIEDQQATKQMVNEFALLTARALDENRIATLYSLATVMAEQDEKLVRRTRH